MCSYGSIRDGVFDGQIESSRDDGGGTYYVERINKFLSEEDRFEGKEGRGNHSSHFSVSLKLNGIFDSFYGCVNSTF